MNIVIQRLQSLASRTRDRLDVLQRDIASLPKITVGPSPPLNPAVNDLWIDTN